jgi:hypothetical protein
MWLWSWRGMMMLWRLRGRLDEDEGKVTVNYLRVGVQISLSL